MGRQQQSSVDRIIRQCERHLSFTTQYKSTPDQCFPNFSDRGPVRDLKIIRDPPLELFPSELTIWNFLGFYN